MLVSAAVEVTNDVQTLSTCGRTDSHPSDAGTVTARSGDEHRAAVQIGVHLARRPAQQLAGRAVAAHDLDRGLREPWRPLLDLDLGAAARLGCGRGERGLEVEREGALERGDWHSGHGGLRDELS